MFGHSWETVLPLQLRLLVVNATDGGSALSRLALELVFAVALLDSLNDGLQGL